MRSADREQQRPSGTVGYTPFHRCGAVARVLPPFQAPSKQEEAAKEEYTLQTETPSLCKETQTLHMEVQALHEKEEEEEMRLIIATARHPRGA